MSRSEITIRVKFSNLWIDVIKTMLQPVGDLKFNIKLDFVKYSCRKFGKVFLELFMPLSKSGSKIQVVRLFQRKNIYESYNHREILSTVKRFRDLNIEKFQCNNWTISADLFYLLMKVKNWENFEFKNWVLWDTFENKYSELGRKQTITIIFDNCRYIKQKNKLII